MRKRIYKLIDPQLKRRKRTPYGRFMLFVILAGTIPMMCRKNLPWFGILEFAVGVFFLMDYILRWITVDIEQKKPSIKAILKYPFSVMGVIDLLAAVSYLISAFFHGQELPSWLMMMRIAGVCKAVRYLKSWSLVIRVLQRQRDQLFAVLFIALEYIFITAIIIFNAEPETFHTFFQAVYWATVSLTTVGYGDIYPVSAIGQVITMISSFFGIAVIAMPAGIITVGIMQELAGSPDK